MSSQSNHAIQIANAHSIFIAAIRTAYRSKILLFQAPVTTKPEKTGKNDFLIFT